MILTANKKVMTAYETAKELQQQLKTLNLLLKPELEIIREYMGESTVLINVEGGQIATYKQNQPSIVFNKDLFAFERPGIYKKYLEEKEGNRPLVLT